MMRSVGFIVALAFSVQFGGSTLWAEEMRPDGTASLRPAIPSFAAESPIVARPGPTQMLQDSLPGRYVSAMTLYRVAMASGLQPPLVATDRIYGDELAGPLQWTWSAENGNMVTRTGKGLFRLSIEGSSKWFREINCRMVQWPGGDFSAVMNCEDGKERTMVVPSDGVVMIDDVAYARIFPREPLPPEEDALTIEFDEGSQTVE